eukprot:4412520-Amphidinium_carterae.1
MDVSGRASEKRAAEDKEQAPGSPAKEQRVGEAPSSAAASRGDKREAEVSLEDLASLTEAEVRNEIMAILDASTEVAESVEEFVNEYTHVDEDVEGY